MTLTSASQVGVEEAHTDEELQKILEKGTGPTCGSGARQISSSW